MRHRRKPNEAERKALREKFEHPERTVLCPTCGGPIEYIENRSGQAALCDPCEIMIALRGI